MKILDPIKQNIFN